MLLEQTKLDITANNIAGAQAPGFKKDVPVTDSFPQMLIYRTGQPAGQPVLLGTSPPGQVGTMSGGATVSASIPDMARGSGKETGNPLDVAVDGEGFLVIGTAAGERYTRNGNLTLDAEGRLVTMDGDPVMGQSGEIVLGEGKAARIEADGTVYEGMQAVDKLRVVSFANPAGMIRYSTTLFGESDESGPAEEMEDARVAPGWLEMSNVNPVTEMVNMISVMRAYEANQKMLQSQDQTLEKAVLEVGRI
jgi:flagellar basal-body rod protein FlgG